MIFNSLGSNYNFTMARRFAKASGDTNSRKKLAKILSEYFDGREVELYYKGREALEAGLSRVDLPAGGNVAINGLTCYVVERAVIRAGLTPIFVDVAPDSLNFDLGNLEKAHKKTPFSAVILQNTLGYTMPDLEKIVEWARKQKILIIEDMAHNFGAEYPNGTKAGTLGDMAMMSFSRDKGVDVVSGGALIYKKDLLKKSNIEISNVGKNQDKKDRFYALRTWLVRKTMPIYFGKILHKFWRKSGKLLSPMQYDNDDKINEMPEWIAGEAAKIWQNNWREILAHKRKLAENYRKNLNKNLLVNDIDDTKTSASLRFPILLKDEKTRDTLTKYLARHGIMLSDIFFDTTVAPKKMQHLSIYQKGSCPNAENVADRLFNLPTHINVSDRQAQKIIELVNKFMEDQK